MIDAKSLKPLHEFYVISYQPAQEWLKDRQGRTLSFDDILHYKKSSLPSPRRIVLMQEIDAVALER